MEPYVLPLLPLKSLDLQRLFTASGEAGRALARFAGLLSSMPYGDILLAPMFTQEAVQSSRIEGTRSTLDEVYETEAGDKAALPVQQEDVNEILNYRNALEYGTSCLAERGITLGLIREMHALLLNGVRGHSKQPGEIRDTQNWIGKRGCSLAEASYVPPAPERLTDYLENWIDYAHAQDLDPLLKVGILHAQFELIHPFLDGNGRVGRLFIPLYLTSTGVLDAPNFYLSEYFETHRDEYTGMLNQLHRSDEAWTEWLLFFLRAIKAQSHENLRRASAMLRLYNELMDQCCRIVNSALLPKLLSAVFVNPIFTKPLLGRKHEELRTTSIHRIIDALEQAGVFTIRRMGSGRKPTLYQLPELSLIAEGKPIPRFDY